MSLSNEDVLKIAKLSRIRLDKAEVEYFRGEISSILNWVDILKEVDTSNVAPLTSVTNQTLPLREDVVTDGNMQELALKNAPESGYGCFIVPKVME